MLGALTLRIYWNPKCRCFESKAERDEEAREQSESKAHRRSSLLVLDREISDGRGGFVGVDELDEEGKGEANGTGMREITLQPLRKPARRGSIGL